MKRDMKKRIPVMIAAVMMTVVNISAQRIQVVDSDGQGIPLASVLTEDGIFIATTDLNGVVDDVKGAARVTVTHVAFKPQQVSIASLTNGRVTMEDIDYDLAEIVVTPKQYIYVEDFYRVYVYRNDSLCYFLSGIMPNAYDIKKKKMEHGSYYQAVAEHCNKMGAGSTWFVRAQRYGAGKGIIKGLPEMEKQLKEKYFVTATVDRSAEGRSQGENPNHTTYRNPEGVVGQLVRTGGQLRFTGDAGKAQMYANKAKGQTSVLKLREKKGYEYQFTLILNDRSATEETLGSSKNQEEGHAAEDFLMELNHWEYNDKKGHVKFFVENYATGHYYMDNQEWKDKKKSMKLDYSNKMTLDQLDSYATSHNIPALSPAARQTIEKLKQW